MGVLCYSSGRAQGRVLQEKAMFRSKATAYAILAAAQIARQTKGSALMTAVIAEAYDLPKAYAGQILSRLTKAGMLRSHRGPHGGYRLTRPANKITLLDIFEAAQGPVRFGDVRGIPGPLRGKVKAALDPVTDQIRKLLGSVTLEALLK